MYIEYFKHHGHVSDHGLIDHKMEKIKWIEEYLEHALEVSYLEGYERAIKLLDRLLYEEPGYGRLHQTMGLIYLNAEEMKQAEMHFRMAILFSPELADSYNHLGNLLRQDERHDEAIEICTKGLKAKQANKTRLLENVGQAYELKKKYSKAIRSYKEALSYSAELWECRVLEENIKRCKRKQK
jgi:tetratricopeptide (TPR) repeat protein